METLSIWVGTNIVYLYGKVNGTDATFTLVGDGYWQAIVPRTSDDIYVIYLQAYSVNGLEYEGTYTIQVLDGWVTPKLDWTRDDFENVLDFNRQKHNVEYIATFVMPLLDMYPAHESIDDVELTSIPLASILNKLESNIAEIGRVLSLTYPESNLVLQQSPVSGKFASAQTMVLPTRLPLLGDWKWGKTWLPEGVTPDYTDTNRWENNMFLVHEWAKRQPAIFAAKISGTIVAGQSNFLPRGVV